VPVYVVPVEFEKELRVSGDRKTHEDIGGGQSKHAMSTLKHRIHPKMTNRPDDAFLNPGEAF
jgi:hypothetical protein